jgi:hypothetical protein
VKIRRNEMPEAEGTDTQAGNVSQDDVAQGMREALTEVLPDDKLEAASDAVTGSSTSYPADGTFVALLFYMRVTVRVRGDNRQFTGNAGGLGSLGGGGSWGDVYTDDLLRLYRDTVSFSFQSTPVYISVQFFDSNSNLLGHYQGGAASVAAGTGGGSGTWS